MSAQLMELVRELKGLNARRKRGEQLSEAEEQRRRKLKAYLKSALEQSQGNNSLATQEGAAVESAVGASPATGSGQGAPAGATPPPGGAPASETTSARISAAPAPSPSSALKETPQAVDAEALFAQAQPPMAGNRAVSPLEPEAPAAPPRAAAPKQSAPAVDAQRASRSDIAEVEAQAERAVRANQARRVTKPEEVFDVLAGAQEEGGYTPPAESFYLEQYYSGYAEEGYTFVEEPAAVDLRPIDPREVELHRAGLLGGDAPQANTAARVPAGLAFLDDFLALYQRGVLPSPDDEVEADSDDPNLLVPGKRKVTVHLLNGTVKRGAIRQLRRGELGFRLEPLGPGRVEELSFTQLKAVFIHTSRARPPEARGRSLTVTFKDRRSVQGVSDDYQPGAPVFSLVPPPGRGQFERILVNAAAIASVR